MKKIVFAILILLIPISVRADYSIKNYRVDITVLDNGDVNIVEAFSMDGSYNGFERNIDYKGNYDGYYGSKITSIENISLYDADDIILNEIRSIDFSNNFESLLINSNLFNKVNSATKGEYGVYTITKNENGENYKIYNPSKMNKDFYIDYTLKNVVIVHEDIAELAINIFKELDETIENLEIYIHIQNNKELLKIWVHGQTENNNEIIDNQTIKITASNLNKFPFDFRIIFDKDTILDINKESNDSVLNNIIDLESKFNFNEDNDEQYEMLKEQVYNSVLRVEQTHDKTDYEKAVSSVKQLKDDDLKTELLVKLINVESKVERKYIVTKVIYTSIMGIIILGLLIIFYQIYKKYNKNNINFKEKYYKEIPSNYPPAVVGYLIKRKLNIRDVSASILKLINNKNIYFEQTKNKKDYKFIKSTVSNLSDSDQKLIKLIFDKEDEITLSRIQKRAKTNYNSFLNQYSNWINSSINEATLENFYEDLLFFKVFGISYSMIGIVLSALFLDNPTYFSPVITIIICILSILYFIIIYKRTKKGNEQYFKWIALKRFMNDFNNMKCEELPKIDLWDEYFIYSISLGCSDKLSKNMQLKIDKITDNVSDIVSFQFLINFYKIIDSSIKSSVEIAYSEKNK